MNDNDIHVLMIEDDAKLTALVREYLSRHQIVVTAERDGEQGLATAHRGSFDLVLLDLMLPGLSGLEICQRIRQHSDIPIIMITARGEEADRVMGLEIGADDYLAKPFSVRELLARIRATVRRVRGQMGPQQKLVTCGELVLDPGAQKARLAEEELDLTGYEFALLYALVERAGRVLSREQLMHLARGSADEAFDRSVDVHISHLRQKLGDNPRHPKRIKTVRGIGYLFMAEG